MYRLHSFVSFILLIFILYSCQRIDNLSIPQEDDTVETMSIPEAQQQFALILSSAISDSKELREFIKEQALLQFDNDYDVFYPSTSSLLVSNNDTFRAVLLRYCSESLLCKIEASLPKLTILVPDYSWVGENCFSVNRWDTDSNLVAVGCDDRLEQHSIYYSGEKIGEINAESFPEFPILIVKENERILVSSSTKGGNQYSFIDSVFDGRKKGITKADNWLWGDIDEVLDNNESPGNNLVSVVGNSITDSELNYLSPRTIAAYNEFGTGWNNACQRDYIYYDMSMTNTDHGILRLFEKDLLYRFAITPYGLATTADAEGEDSILLNNGFVSLNNDLPDCAEAVRRMWADGHYEIKIDVYQKPTNGSSSIITSFYFDIDPSELMYVTKCNRNYHWNIFGQSWNTYTIQQSYIEPKWYYPVDLSLPVINNHWNLASGSDNIWLNISEMDQSATITTTHSVTFKQSNTVAITSSTTGDEAIKMSYGVSNSYTQEISTTETKTIVTQQDSDILGTSYVEYTDNIVTGTTTGGYSLKCYSTGRFQFSLIPVDMTNEQSILSYLRSAH